MVSAVQAPDPRTVVINFSEPYPTLLLRIWRPYFGVLSPRYLDTLKAGAQDHQSGRVPYKFTGRSADGVITLNANPEYAWGAETLKNRSTPYLRTLKFRATFGRLSTSTTEAVWGREETAMLKREDNELITRVGPGTPMGETMRRYWMPVVLGSELPQADSDPIRVKLLGEELVAFRDTNGQVGLIQNNCPHRGASLFFGRNEEAGIRCVYHGWKFDISGQCIDMPNEPAESDFKSKVKAVAYPTAEKAAIIWAYMGPPDKQPPLPDYEWMRAPAGHCWVSKTIENCNYLQAMEGGLDTSHSSFLHRDLDPEGLLNPRARSTAPRLEVLNTDYGYMYASIRHLPEDRQNFVRVYHYVMPFYQLRAGGASNTVGNTDGHMWVPIDDTTVWAWNFHFNIDEPQPIEEFHRFEHMMGRGPEDYIPGTFKLKANISNDYGLSRERQKSVNYTGIEGTNTQDFAVQESMGPIYDRTQERLGSADTAIIQMRRLLLDALRAVQQGLDPTGSHGQGSTVRPAQMLLPEDARWTETRLREALVAQY